MQALKLPSGVHAGSRPGSAVVPDNSSRLVPTSRKVAVRATALNNSFQTLNQTSLRSTVARISSRNVSSRYRSDRSADELTEDSKASSSAVEAAAYNQLTAGAAAQAATDQLASHDSTPTASLEGAETAALAAGSVVQPGTDGHAAQHASQNGGAQHHHHEHHHGHQLQHHHRNSKQRKTGGGETPSHKLQARLDSMSSQYQELDSRLDTLENTLVTLLSSVKERARRPAVAASVGPGGAASVEGTAESPMVEAAADGDLADYDYDSDDEHGGLFDLKKLQSSLSENINKGYLEAVKHLREMLMAYEWHLHGKELAERKGVAAFEKHCAEHDVDIDFDVLTRLYSNPNDLSVLPNNKLKLLARSIIQQAVDERYCNIYFECTNTAKELAKTGLKDIIPDSAGKVGGVIKDILPVPGFLKK